MCFILFISLSLELFYGNKIKNYIHFVIVNLQKQKQKEIVFILFFFKCIKSDVNQLVMKK